MGLNETVSAERIHIGFFGLRNAGKSSLVNAITGQSLSVVSDVKGTTTDPVKKAMELLPLGPVVIIDTPGIDDEGVLGEKRVHRTNEILSKIHIAVIVTDANTSLSDKENELVDLLKKRSVPYIVAYNKSDISENKLDLKDNELLVSAVTGENVDLLKAKLGQLSKTLAAPRFIVGDMLSEGDTVIMVTPIDESAPKGRLILPQQLTLRELLDKKCTAVVCQPEQLKTTIENLKNEPKLVITDSQVFGRVAGALPPSVALTSFSILMARYKGDLEVLVDGAARLSKIKNGDKILISEGCTHHRQCNDIGTVKMPRWIRDFTGCEPEFSFTSGGDFPDDLSGFSLVVHCGGCMLNEREMSYRLEKARAQGVPMVNYGVAIAMMHGILKRSLEIFPEIAERI